MVRMSLHVPAVSFSIDKGTVPHYLLILQLLNEEMDEARSQGFCHQIKSNKKRTENQLNNNFSLSFALSFFVNNSLNIFLQSIKYFFYTVIYNVVEFSIHFNRIS